MVTFIFCLGVRGMGVSQTKQNDNEPATKAITRTQQMTEALRKMLKSAWDKGREE